MRTFTEASNRLGSRESRKLENNTYLQRRGEAIAVKLHSTDVVTFQPDGRVVLTSGGWRTPTTKDRLNKYSPVNIWSQKGQWLVAPFGQHINQDPSKIFYFQDGTVIHPDGKITGAMSEAEAKRERKLRERVKKYAANYLAALKAGKVGKPSGGDCWYCVMKEVKTGTPLGELSGRGKGGHIEAHIKEKYYVPSLAWNALEAMGASQMARFNLACYQGLTDEKPFMDLDEQLERTIRRYCLRELGLTY